MPAHNISIIMKFSNDVYLLDKLSRRMWSGSSRCVALLLSLALVPSLSLSRSLALPCAVYFDAFGQNVRQHLMKYEILGELLC